jgi:hypothetical protein
MASLSTVAVTEARPIHTLSVTRLLVTGGATAAVIFVLCWLGTLISSSSPTHAYIGLFTLADENSTLALVEGSVWSLLFGAAAGTVLALVYNATGALGRR